MNHKQGILLDDFQQVKWLAHMTGREINDIIRTMTFHTVAKMAKKEHSSIMERTIAADCHEKFIFLKKILIEIFSTDSNADC